MFAADVFNTLAYTNPRLQKAHVYRLGETYVPLAATQAVAEAEAAEALAALTLRVTGYAKDIKPSWICQERRLEHHQRRQHPTHSTPP